MNLKVLPKSIATREFIEMMRGFTRGLGVRCSTCHKGEEDMPLEKYDFPSDDKLLKRKAREMIRMVNTINERSMRSWRSGWSRRSRCSALPATTA